ncbi:MAG: DUF3800 domain-containing protein [bacterium]|nr:DUF3800 domain-containing protein [bacterium]
MYLLFIDESGNPERSDPSLIFTLTGIAIEARQLKSLSAFYHGLKYNFFHQEMSMPIPQNNKKARLIREKQELKDILKPRNASNRHCKRFMTVLIKRCIDEYNISVHPVIFLKKDLDNSPSSAWVYPLALKRIMTSFNNYLCEKTDIGILVLDSRGPITDDNLIASYYSHASNNPYGRALTNLIGPPFFARSHITYGLQIGHHIAKIVYGNYYDAYYPKQGGKEYSHVREFWNMLANTEALYGKTNKQKGIIVWQ